jgi:biotin synthase
MDWAKLAERVIDGEALTCDEARAVLTADDEQVPALVAAAHAIRRRYFGNRVKVNFLVNIRSGICP